tara:strand:- start:850 stop:1086 length:237 start_codon:yes stop_codon:yes gene_type:complete
MSDTEQVQCVYCADNFDEDNVVELSHNDDKVCNECYSQFEECEKCNCEFNPEEIDFHQLPSGVECWICEECFDDALNE